MAWEGTGRRQPSASQKGFSLGTKSVGTLMVGFPASRCVRNACLLFKPPGLWYFVKNGSPSRLSQQSSKCYREKEIALFGCAGRALDNLGWRGSDKDYKVEVTLWNCELSFSQVCFEPTDKYGDWFVARRIGRGSLKTARGTQEQWLYRNNSVRKHSHHAAMCQVLLRVLYLHLFIRFSQQRPYEVDAIIPFYR